MTLGIFFYRCAALALVIFATQLPAASAVCAPAVMNEENGCSFIWRTVKDFDVHGDPFRGGPNSLARVSCLTAHEGLDLNLRPARHRVMRITLEEDLEKVAELDCQYPVAWSGIMLPVINIKVDKSAHDEILEIGQKCSLGAIVFDDCKEDPWRFRSFFHLPWILEVERANLLGRDLHAMFGLPQSQAIDIVFPSADHNRPAGAGLAFSFSKSDEMEVPEYWAIRRRFEFDVSSGAFLPSTAFSDNKPLVSPQRITVSSLRCNTT